MAILVDETTRLVVQGLTGKEGTFHTLRNKAYGTTVVAGVGYTMGLVRSVAGARGMWIHVAAALALVPLVIWHVLARRARPRRTDLSRRALIRTGTNDGAARL